MITFIIFKPGDQRKFLYKVKEAVHFPWREIMANCQISRTMFYNYLREEYPIREDIFLQLCALAKLDPKALTFTKKLANLQYDYTIPSKHDSDLAQFIGIILGDGHIGKMGKQIYISFHSELEQSYANKVRILIKRLFNKNAAESLFAGKKAMQLVFNSKGIVEFLTQEIGLPSGRRIFTPKNKIPQFIFEKRELLNSCIRGLFDSEGGFHQRHHNAARIYIYNKCPVLLKSIFNALTELGYHTQLKWNCVKLGRAAEITRFFNEIKPQNDYKVIKYVTWLKEGRFVSIKEIMERLPKSQNIQNTAVVQR